MNAASLLTSIAHAIEGPSLVNGGTGSVETLLASSTTSVLPPLVVVLPVLAAIVALVFGSRIDRGAWSIAALTAAVQVVLAAVLAWTVIDGGRVIHVLGGFEPPFGIVLVVDGLSALVALLISLVMLGVLPHLRRAGPRGNAFYTGFLLLVSGLTGLSLTGDVFNMYVFLEITGLAAYALVASDDSGPAAVAALKYLVLGTVGASLFLLGIGYAFIATGTLNMADLSVRLAEVGYRSTAVQAAFGFMVVGLGVKIALFPLHTWQPSAYAASADGVSAFISALVSTVSAYALARIVLSVFTTEFFAANPIAQELLLYGASLSIIAGSTLAVTQREIKRTLAYSSVSQFGLVVVGFALANRTGVLGGTIHLLGHAVMKGGLFLAAGIIAMKVGARTVDEYAGLASRAPITSGAFAVLAFGMIGVPPAVGFVGKWYILLGAVEAGEWPIAAIVVISTLLTLAYFARLIERMYFSETSDSSSATSITANGGPTDGYETDGGSTSGRSEEPNEKAAFDPVVDDLPNEAVTPGMIAVVVLTAVLAVVLGLGATAIEGVLQPALEVLL